MESTGQKMEKEGQDRGRELFSKIEQMFDQKSKFAKLVEQSVLENYKETYKFLCDKLTNGELPTSTDYFGGNKLSENIYKSKYFLKDVNTGEPIENRPEEVFIRLASFIASNEDTEEKRLYWAEKFYRDLYEGYYLPGGRVMAGAGDLFRLKTLANCFVTTLEDDSLESIYKTAYEAARTYSYGGGTGLDISQLRPRDAKVHNAADTSTGAVSFMELYSLTTGLIGQSGRRGALMLTIDIKHPDIMEFIHIKKKPYWTTNQILDRLNNSGDFTDKQLEEIKKSVIENTQVRFANISIKTSDEFMSAVEEQKKYGKNQILVYQKEKNSNNKDLSADEVNYSYGMSNKDISKYQLLHNFNNIEELNEYLSQNNFSTISKQDLEDKNQRDMYADYVLEGEGEDLAVRFSGDFMTFYKSARVGEIREIYKARDIWNSFVEGNYQTAEPGLIFWSQMSKYSPSNYVGRPITCTNPCGEVPLESGGACNLGSINLSRMVDKGFTNEAEINWERLDETAENIVRFLDNVVWWNERLNALDRQRESASLTRRIGVGVMGIADMFNQLGIKYDSQEGMDILEKVMNFITQKSYRTSAYLAEEKGPSPALDLESYKENPFYQEVLDETTKEKVSTHGVRNLAILSIAPTGTISNAICGFKTQEKNYIGVSGGIEPIFALYYTRRSETLDKEKDSYFKVFHSTVQAYVDMYGLQEKVDNTSSEEEMKELLPEHFFRTSHQISPEKRVDIQGLAQKYIDHSISSTVNLPEDIDPEVVSDIYLKAWNKGLKGITIYRDGSRFPVLSVEGKKTQFQEFKEKEFKIKQGQEERTVKGDEILELESGRLSTVYHAKKENLL